MYISQTMAATKIVYNIVNEIKELIDQHSCIHFFFLAKIYHEPINTVTAGPPFIFIQQGARILNEVHILRTQLIYFSAYRLEQGGNSDCFIYRHGYIANTKLDRVEKRVYAKVPPDLFSIVNTIGLDQELDKIVVRFNTFK